MADEIKPNPTEGGRGRGGPGRGPGRGPRRTRQDGPPKDGAGGDELSEKVVFINRSAKVVKGGRRFSFSALVVAGDKKGNVGIGLGKAGEVAEAIKKGGEVAKRAMVGVFLEGPTIPHSVSTVFDGAHVLLRPASPGTGIIAGGPMRAVFETLGIHDVVAKSLGSSNPYNMVRATFDALRQEDSPRGVAARRGKKVSEIVTRRRDGAGEGGATAEA